jgi:hypothetical protein
MTGTGVKIMAALLFSAHGEGLSHHWFRLSDDLIHVTSYPRLARAHEPESLVRDLG